MSTSKSLVATLLAGAFAVLAAHCSAGGECLRFSDCAQGYTCSAGQCVLADGAAEEAGEGGDESQGDAPTSTPVVDSGSGGHTSDATATDTGAAHDAGADASGDAHDAAADHAAEAAPHDAASG